jgi:PX domain
MLPTASVVSFEETTDAFGPHIVYNIAVQCGDSVETVQRRYTEFVTLHDQLKSANNIIAEYPFPRRRLTSGLLSKSKIANERREAFNTYLQFILDVNPRLSHISDFLNISTEDEDEDDDACSPLHETLDGVSLQAALERSVLKDKHNLDSPRETAPPKGPSLGNRGNLIITVLVTLVFFPLLWFHITYPGNLGSFPKREWSVIDWQSRSTDRGRDKGELDKVLMHATNVFSTSGMIGGVRFTLEVLIAVLVVISVSHRITGFLFGMLVRFMLCKVSGSFQVMLVFLYYPLYSPLFSFLIFFPSLFCTIFFTLLLSSLILSYLVSFVLSFSSLDLY